MRLLLTTGVSLGVVLAIATPGAVAVPPALTTPGNTTAEATSAKGAVVDYSVTADKPGAQIMCTPPSGSMFPLGQTTVKCTATDPVSHETSSASFTVTVIDTTPPVLSSAPTPITAKVNRKTNAAVSYPTPVARDAVDGVVAVTCMPASGSTFELGETEVMCIAADVRGNETSVTFTVRVVDNRPPPPVTDVVVLADTHLVALKWRLPASKDVAGTEVVRYPGAAVVFRGRGTAAADSTVQAGRRYRYVVNTYDLANRRSQGVAVNTSAQATKLIQPQDGAKLTVPPLLSWREVAGASYYNVQLWAVRPEGLVKILTVWPTPTRFQLPKTWNYQGKPQVLAKGTYHWYVWPGVGSIALGNYGELIGSSTFTITG
ncbi:MAG TPA: HYR domain-containing protein [Gaiellaceae bacterium]|nr:HYR domain-containing protein [Gaiellaceae bacterium]